MNYSHWLLYLFITLLIAETAHGADFVDFKQAQIMALEAEPGQVVKTDLKKIDQNTLYQFRIKKGNGAQIDVEVDGGTGAVSKHAYTPDDLHKEPAISQNRATKNAINHLIGRVNERDQYGILSNELTAYENNPAYKIELSQSGLRYRVFVSSETGEILAAERL